MKNYLNDNVGKTLSPQPKKKADDNDYGSSQESTNSILRRKPGSTNKGRPHSMVYEFIPDIHVTHCQEWLENTKRRSQVEIRNPQNSPIEDFSKPNSSNNGKSSSLQRSNTMNWISPFSRRKLKKSRNSLTQIENEEALPNFNTVTNALIVPKEQPNTNRSFAEKFQNLRSTTKCEHVFGNKLENVPLYSGGNDSSTCFYKKEMDIPEFLVKSIEKIETMLSTIGLYRINGDAVFVAKLRNDINKRNYKPLDRCKSVAAITSALKMFLRDLPSPLIKRNVVDLCLALDLAGALKNNSTTLVLPEIKQNVSLLPTLNYNVLRLLMLHLKRVAANEENKMSSQGLAIIFGQNLIPNRTPEKQNIGGILLEAEKTNIFIELLIIHVDEIFLK